MDSFKNKVAIVTGGASGIGRALCKELARRNAVVILADINEEGVRQVASSITEAGGRAVAAPLDVSREKDIRKLINDTASEYGRLDYMFNNAGIAILGELRDMTTEDWSNVVNINLWGVIHGTTAAYSVMVKQGFGHIINTASLSGLIPYPTALAYSTTKHAVVGLSTSLRAEAADLGIKVSVVCPGYVRTPMVYTSPYLKVNREAWLAQRPFQMMDVTKATRIILRGVARNQAIIVFPLLSDLTWRLYRLHPGLLGPALKQLVKKFRKCRTES